MHRELKTSSLEEANANITVDSEMEKWVNDISNLVFMYVKVTPCLVYVTFRLITLHIKAVTLATQCFHI
jgi:hypothetical protein